jgi:hydrogenase maturation protein HypF
VLVADRAQFERVAHFKAYPLPGGERAITAPWRMAVSALRAEGLPAGAAFANRSRQEQAAIEGVLAAGINCPLTSSAGRLFDVVAALLGLADEITYEAQAAIRLEAVADPAAGAAYPFAVAVDTTPWRIDFGPTIAAVLADRGRGAAVATIAGRFHRTVAAALLDVCCFLRERRELETVVLSGGVFQNELLLRLMVEGLRRRAFAVFTNTLVPPNDGGLALGQVAVASARLAGEGEQE